MGSSAWFLSASVALVLVCLQSCQGAEWGYTGDKGVDYWATNYPDFCSKRRQSPIDLKSSSVVHDESMEDFQLQGFNDVNNVTWELTNNGHTAQVTYTGGNLMVKKGSLNGDFKVAQFHFHWGSDSTKGSEHTIDSASYPMEVHVVCYRHLKYDNLKEAVGHEDGLAVLGFFFEISQNTNPTIQKLIDAFHQIKYAGNSTSLQPFPLNNMLAGLENYYRYKGSLTTPTCNEVVTWTVFKNTIKISEAQMQAFRELKDSHMHSIVNNYRPIQALNNRDIKASFFDERFSSKSAGLLANGLALLPGLAMSLWLRL